VHQSAYKTRVMLTCKYRDATRHENTEDD